MSDTDEFFDIVNAQTCSDVELHGLLEFAHELAMTQTGELTRFTEITIEGEDSGEEIGVEIEWSSVITEGKADSEEDDEEDALEIVQVTVGSAEEDFATLEIDQRGNIHCDESEVFSYMEARFVLLLLMEKYSEDPEISTIISSITRYIDLASQGQQNQIDRNESAFAFLDMKNYTFTSSEDDTEMIVHEYEGASTDTDNPGSFIALQQNPTDQNQRGSDGHNLSGTYFYFNVPSVGRYTVGTDEDGGIDSQFYARNVSLNPQDGDVYEFGALADRPTPQQVVSWIGSMASALEAELSG